MHATPSVSLVATAAPRLRAIAAIWASMVEMGPSQQQLDHDWRGRCEILVIGISQPRCDPRVRCGADEFGEDVRIEDDHKLGICLLYTSDAADE